MMNIKTIRQGNPCLVRWGYDHSGSRRHHQANYEFSSRIQTPSWWW
jgi:hypothetical protein